jgi:hypothetical protein
LSAAGGKKSIHREGAKSAKKDKAQGEKLSMEYG